MLYNNLCYKSDLKEIIDEAKYCLLDKMKWNYNNIQCKALEVR